MSTYGFDDLGNRVRMGGGLSDYPFNNYAEIEEDITLNLPAVNNPFEFSIRNISSSSVIVTLKSNLFRFLVKGAFNIVSSAGTVSASGDVDLEYGQSKKIVFGASSLLSIVLFPEDSSVNLWDRCSDNSVIFFDRGVSFGEYMMKNGEPMRLTGTDGWRYMMCEEYDLPHYDSAVGTTTINEEYTGKTWGTTGIKVGGTSTGIGTGLANTNKLIETYLSETDYIWYYINKHRTETGKQWFLPSLDELNILYENKDKIGNFSTTTLNCYYWSSSEYWSDSSWSQYFSSGNQSSTNKNDSDYRVRLLRLV